MQRRQVARRRPRRNHESSRTLILSLAPAPLYYARNYLPEVDERGFAADFDVVTHLKFADEDGRRAWLAAVSAEGSGVAEDEARFLDRARTRSWVVEEHISQQ